MANMIFVGEPIAVEGLAASRTSSCVEEAPADANPPAVLADRLLEVAGAGAPAHFPTVLVADLVTISVADVPAEALSWLWPGRIPLGKLTLLFGDPGLGKSFITMDLAARVSRGMQWPDAADGAKPSAPGGVILLSAEDDLADTIHPRLDAAGGDSARIEFVRGVESAAGIDSFNLARHLPSLESAVHQTPDVRLIIIDPISAYLGDTDSHRDARVRALLAPLADLAARYGVAVVAVTHLNKRSGGQVLQRAMGSIAFAATARTAYLVVADAGNPKRRLFLQAKSNLAQETTGLAYTIESVELAGIGPVGRVVWEPEPVTITANEALAAAPANPKKQTVCEAASKWLLETLANGPMQANDVAAAAVANGLAWRTIRRAKEALGVKAKRDGFKDAKWYWALPDGPTSPAAPVHRVPKVANARSGHLRGTSVAQ